jgi:mRNA-degrading endonuclease toxin of MazEF toxin-antitoxin module
VVVPPTASIGAWTLAHPALYPIVKAGAAQLTRDSAALTDHVRGMDAQRLEGYIGTLSHEEYTPIKEALGRVLGFGGEQ